jgi:amino acid adenylation domain-containing protein
MLVNEFLSRSAARLPDKTALVFDDTPYTYSEIYRRSRNLAAFLINKGLKRGDRVGVYLGNSPEAAVSIFGVLEAGGCFVVINPTIKEEKLTHILKNSGARFLIADISKRPIHDHAFPHLAEPPLVIYCKSKGSAEYGFEGIIDSDSDTVWPKPLEIDLAAIIYTSGSTGDPKGVTMSHYNMVSAATSITTYLENVEDDIILNMLPFSFDYGLYQLLMAFKMGGTLVLERTFGYPYQIIELIRKYQVTGLPCVPTMFAILLQLEHLEEENLDSVTYISNTAAALPPNYIPRLRKAFPNARVYSMYGLTECKRVSYLPPHMIDKKPDSVGVAMPNTEVWIADDNGNLLPPGKIGELVVRGGSVMRGYWRDPEGTSARLRPGRYPWEKVLYTGDLFKMDEESYLYFVGRRDDIIKCRGERVSPKEIVNVLHGMEHVLNVRVTGVPHEIFGQAIKAEIVTKDGRSLSEKAVKHFCRQHLEDLMVPQIIEFVEHLPMSTSGKIKRKD